MKNITSLRLFLATLLLAMVTGTTWAGEGTISIGTNPSNSSSTSYLTSAQTFTIDGVTFVMNNYNPSSGQIRGNQGSASSNFYLYNTTPLPGEILSIEITVTTATSTFVASNTYLNTGTSAITSPKTSGTNPSGQAWSGLSDYTYFCISMAKGGTSNTCKISGITITYKTAGAVKSAAGLEFSESSAKVDLSEAASFVAPTLSNPNSLTVTYSSSNSDVAEVDATTGALTIKAKGTTDISAKSSETDVYYEGSAAYTLTVTDYGHFYWEEDWSDASANATPSDVNADYSFTNGGSDTKLYDQTLAGGTSPELLLGKSSGKFSYTVDVRGHKGTLTLEFLANRNSTSVSTTTDGVTIGTVSNTGSLYTYPITLAKGVKTVDIIFAAGSDNIRLDNIRLYGDYDESLIGVDIDVPTIDLESGTYTTAQTVKLTSESAPYIVYTTDGTDPSYENSVGELISSGDQVTIPTTLTLKAIAVDDAGNESAVVSRTYTIKPNAPTLTEGGNYNGSVDVEMTDEAGLEILYTLDGTTPSYDNDATDIYEGTALTLTATTSVTAVSVLEVTLDGTTYYNYSDPVVETYSVKDAASVDATFKFNDSSWLNEKGISNSDLISSLVEGNIEIGGTKGTGNNTPAYYSSGNAIRIYMNNTFTVASTDGTPITEIVFTGTTNAYNVISLPEGQPGTLLKDGATSTWTASASDEVVLVTFSGPTTNQARYSTITVTTKGDAIVTEDLSVSAAGFSTLYTERPFEVPAGVTAGIVSAAGEADADGIATLTIDWLYNEGDIVPAATPLLIKAEEGNYTYTCKATVAQAPEGNLLKGSAVDTETTGETGDKFYILSYGQGAHADELGFYYAKPEGAAFTSKAGKCWLAISASDNVKGFILFDEVATSINSVNTELTAGQAAYDLQGRRVETPAHGVFIIGGKKVILK